MPHHCSLWNLEVRDVHFLGEAPDSLDVTFLSCPDRALNQGIGKVHGNSALLKKPDKSVNVLSKMQLISYSGTYLV